jgi:hypothetical protein
LYNPKEHATIPVTSTGNVANDFASWQAKSVIVYIGESSLNTPGSDGLAEFEECSVALHRTFCMRGIHMHALRRLNLPIFQSTCKLCCMLQGCFIVRADCGMPRAAQCSTAPTSLIQIIVRNLVFEGLVWQRRAVNSLVIPEALTSQSSQRTHKHNSAPAARCLTHEHTNTNEDGSIDNVHPSAIIESFFTTSWQNRLQQLFSPFTTYYASTRGG